MNDLSQIFELELVKEILACPVFHYKEGDVVIDYGKTIRMMPLILEGTMKVLKEDENGQELLLYYLSSTESCSMAYSCCMESQISEVKAIAEEDLTLIAIPQQKLEVWLCKYPSWKSYIMHSLNHRFLELLKSIESIAFKKLDERLIEYLKEKKRVTQSTMIKVSHHVIAEELASSRVVISRLLKQLENEKRVILYRNEIKILQTL